MAILRKKLPEIFTELIQTLSVRRNFEVISFRTNKYETADSKRDEDRYLKSDVPLCPLHRRVIFPVSTSYTLSCLSKPPAKIEELSPELLASNTLMD